MMRKENSDVCLMYIIRNTANTKVYIGQTWQTLQDRWRCGRGYNDCPLMCNAIRKHGAEAFYYEVLCEVKTQEEADLLEDKFIDEYRSDDRRYGYNIRRGGSYGKHSKQTTKKMSMRDHSASEPRYFANEEEKFMSKVKKQGDCWLWTGSLNPNGEGRYSSCYYGIRTEHKAHRFAYEFYIGKLPKQCYVRHTCKNNHCVNPKHLIVLSPEEFYAARAVEVAPMMIGNQYGKGSKHTEEHKQRMREQRRGEGNKIAKLTNRNVKRIKRLFIGKEYRRLLIGNNAFFREIGAEYGVSMTTIADIWHNRTWVHIK